MKKIPFILVGAVLLIGGFIFYTQARLPVSPEERNRKINEAPSSKQAEASLSPSPLFPAKINESSILLEVADSEEERILGLSGRENLAPNRGLLFKFEEAGFPGIWMKDMNFSIDILWLDQNFKIVDMREEASPASFPEVFIPKEKSQYVLEVNAGFVKEKKITIGDELIIF